MANNGTPYITGSGSNQTINIPVGGGNLSLNLHSGSLTLTNSSGTSSATGNVEKGTETLTAGPVSLTITATGADSVSINTGLVSGTLNFEPSGTTANITGATLSASYGLANASVSITEEGSSWGGSITYGLKAPGNNALSNWINGYTQTTKTFDPATDSPCVLVGTGMARSACSILESSANSGSINQQENQDLKDLGIVGDLANPATSAGDNALVADDSSGIAFDESYPLFAGDTPPPGATGIGGTGGSSGGGSPAAVKRGGYAAALAKGSAKGGTNIAQIASGQIHTDATGNGSVMTADMASQIARVTSGTNQSFWAVGTKDGIILQGQNGAIGGIDENMNATMFSENASKTGASYLTYNAQGVITAAAFDGTGETQAINSSTVNIANSSSATLTGTGDYVYLGTGSTVTMNGNNNGVYLGSGETATIFGTGNTAAGSSDVVHLNGSGERLGVNGIGDTVYASNATITFYVQVKAQENSETVIGTGDTVNYHVATGGTNAQPTPAPTAPVTGSSINPVVSASQLVHAMSSFSPAAGLESNVTDSVWQNQHSVLARNVHFH